MGYLARTAELRAHPDRLLPGARSVVCLAFPHGAGSYRAPDGSELARYARGADYHGTLRQRATRVAGRAAARIGEPLAYRVCVDSAPLPERSLGAAAGLGWIGKNGCLIDAEHGSFLLLAEILLDLDLPPDEPVAEQCGSCMRCLEACPTDAFLEPGLLDAGRCLAYWTIEHRGPIPDAFKERLGARVFGCDVCQEVCPWNSPIPPPSPAAETPTRREWLEMGSGAFRRRFGATALSRAGRRGLQRNAAASAGAVGDDNARASLPRLEALAEPGVSEAARWAAARLADSRS
jgi:epoxyqueuosine reductase